MIILEASGEMDNG